MHGTINGKPMEWTAGIIGTDGWVTDKREARAFATTARTASLMRAGVALTDTASGFIGYAAPSGISERTDGHGHGVCVPWTVAQLRQASVGFTSSYAAFVAQTDAQARREALAQARAIETARRAALHAPDETDALADETRYVPPVADEWRGVPLRTLTALAETGWHAADAILQQLDTAYAVRQYRTRMLTACMQGDAQTDGRGTAPLSVDPETRRVSRAEGVNGTETRHTERWQATARHAVRGQDGRLIDQTCYVVAPDGTRTPFVAPVRLDTDGTARTVATVDTAGTYAARLARFGAVGNGATD